MVTNIAEPVYLTQYCSQGTYIGLNKDENHSSRANTNTEIDFRAYFYAATQYLNSEKSDKWEDRLETIIGLDTCCYRVGASRLRWDVGEANERGLIKIKQNRGGS